MRIVDPLLAITLLGMRRDPRQRQRGYQLFRIGDAVASRNIHAATYDALRLCSAL